MALDHSPHPALRLVADTRPPQRIAAQHSATDRIARENASAAALTPSDARWIFAIRVRAVMEGGQAAILPPDRRERLLRLATRIGLRPFDANLIVAIVQDSVRTGSDGLDHAVEQRLTLIRPPQLRRAAGRSIILAAALGLAILAALIAWVLG